ncbi:MAG: hemolysin III family protein [Deltaproteobacteria bacterium]|nr:hemolysin III family protein [Deltaproteobacteria bacterium]
MSPSETAAATLPTSRYTPAEERANSATHALGACLALGALAWMLAVATGSGDPRQIGTVTVFGASLFALYLASSLYHGPFSVSAKQKLRIADHIGIYLLIAGTYTPITLVGLEASPWGLGLFAAIWSFAALGIALEVFWVDRPRWISVAVYVAMGWLAILAVGPLFDHLPTGALWLIFGGGAVYTGGTLFYLIKVPYAHAIWHLFVIGGSACHVAAVALYVVG